MRIRRRTFDPYVVAHQRAYAWAGKAMAYRSAVQSTRAKAAVDKVQHWLSKIAALEAAPAQYDLTGVSDACKD